jgi:hypothetical protein
LQRWSSRRRSSSRAALREQLSLPSRLSSAAAAAAAFPSQQLQLSLPPSAEQLLAAQLSGAWLLLLLLLCGEQHCQHCFGLLHWRRQQQGCSREEQASRRWRCSAGCQRAAQLPAASLLLLLLLLRLLLLLSCAPTAPLAAPAPPATLQQALHEQVGAQLAGVSSAAAAKSCPGDGMSQAQGVGLRLQSCCRAAAACGTAAGRAQGEQQLPQAQQPGATGLQPVHRQAAGRQQGRCRC